MDEFIPTQRDGHVGDAGKAPRRVLVLAVLAEKQQVARLRSAPDRVADPELLVGIAWRIGAEEAHEGLCQARTVKAEGAAPAPQIWHARAAPDQLQGSLDALAVRLRPAGCGQNVALRQPPDTVVRQPEGDPAGASLHRR